MALKKEPSPFKSRAFRRINNMFFSIKSNCILFCFTALLSVVNTYSCGKDIFSKPVSDFVERYFSELSKLDKAKQLEMLQKDRLSLKVNGKEYRETKIPLQLILSEIDENTPVTLNENDREIQIIWVINDKRETVEFIFPKQYDLILGKNKSELTQSFQSDLMNFQYQLIPETLESDFEVTDTLDNLHADLGNFYIIPQMKSGRYIQKKGGKYEYVLSERRGEESLLNLFSHSDQMNRHNALDITVKAYNVNHNFTCTLDRLCAYMKMQNCKAYVGLETENEKEYTGTAFYVNRELMYEHLVYFIFPKTALQREQDVVQIKIYPYIPIGNIADLYNDISNY